MDGSFKVTSQTFSADMEDKESNTYKDAKLNYENIVRKAHPIGVKIYKSDFFYNS